MYIIIIDSFTLSGFLYDPLFSTAAANANVKSFYKQVSKEFLEEDWNKTVRSAGINSAIE